MTLLDKPMQELLAEDLMSRDVLTVPRSMTLRGAARILMRARISGAPVVDEAGRCVGVLSTTDFLRLAMTSAEPVSHERCVSCEWEVFDLEELPEDRVERAMTPDPVIVSADTPLRELARRMIDAHIHRVIVVDAVGRPVGVVSTTDILAAVAR